MINGERITALEEVEEVTNADYVMLDSATAGVRKFKASNLGGGSATLIEKSITANGEYDAEDDEADGYSSVTVNVPSVDGVYFDGNTDNKNNLKLPYYVEDYEIEVNFYISSQQTSRMIFGNTANGYYPILFMNATTGWTINTGNNSQFQYVPSNGFAGNHKVIINRLSDRAVIFDDDTVGTYGTSNFSSAIPFIIGKALSINPAEFILNSFKLTDHSSGDVVANYVAGFRTLSSGIKIPCLLNTVDDTYVDLDMGNTSEQFNGRIKVAKNPTVSS